MNKCENCNKVGKMLWSVEGYNICMECYKKYCAYGFISNDFFKLQPKYYNKNEDISTEEFNRIVNNFYKTQQTKPTLQECIMQTLTDIEKEKQKVCIKQKCSICGEKHYGVKEINGELLCFDCWYKHRFVKQLYKKRRFI